jgi:DNA-binding transcriptional ArsR family regulator
VLEQAGLVRVRREGTRRLYAVDPDGLVELRSWLDAFWDDALATFKRLAEVRR